jgi:ABC-type transport system involved in multi-copper enzyme maturation permease subunit
LIGVAAIAAAAWCGIKLGLVFGKFDAPPAWSALAPGALSFLGLGLFFTGCATLLSSVVSTRTQVVGLAVGFFVVEVALLIVGRLSQRFEWMGWLTILSAYQPTRLTLGLAREPASYWPLVWQYHAWLFGLSGALLALGALVFCRRDVPAPL